MSKKKKTIEELLEEALLTEEEQSYEVPNNWKWVKMGSVITLLSGRDVSAKLCNNEGKGIPYIMGASNIVDNELTIERWIETPTVVSVRGDVLISVKGTVGKIIIQELEEVHLSRQIMALRCNDRVFNKYLYLYIQTYIEKLKEAAKGIIPGISRDDILNAPFPLLPLNEQKRIAEKVERLISRIEVAKQLIEGAKETFEIRRAAILDKAFRGELTRKWREENQYDKLESKEQSGTLGPYKIPNGWEWKKLGEIGELQRGKSKHRPRNDPKLFGGEYPFIQTGDVARASDYVEDFSQTLSEFGYNQSKLFPIGTVCITIAANIADTAILKFPCCFPDSVVGFVPFEESVSSEFVHYYINTIKNDLEHYAPATAQKNINLKILNEVLVPVPSLVEHDIIMEKLKDLLDKEYEANRYLVLENSIAPLKQSILSKAFRGELGTNDPSEENAIELLKEVLQEQVK